MTLLEYEAKNILKKYGVAVPSSFLYDSTKDHELLNFPMVVKSQVPTGGRGKLGGVRFVSNHDEYQLAIKQILSLPIKGYKPKNILAEQALDIKNEYYLSITIDRAIGRSQLIAHKDGGIEIETQTGFFKTFLDDNFSQIGEQLAELFEIEDKAFLLADITENLYRCFTSEDATLIEINPLILTKQASLIAGDCKMTLDDAANFRHPDWQFETEPVDSNFVPLDQTGTIATIANGAGLAMATIDAVAAAGLKPANFLDIGGNATTDSILASLRRITDLESVEAIVINIFGGIVRCDEVANAIIEAKNQLTNLPPLYIRLAGNNSLAAKMILDSHGIKLYEDLADCLEAIK